MTPVITVPMKAKSKNMNKNDNIHNYAAQLLATHAVLLWLAVWAAERKHFSLLDGGRQSRLVQAGGRP
eukprot:scaffold32644_cov22-Tisochrysis_lutea.AAC.1